MALDSVIGQQKVARMLKNAIRRGRLTHAYIFFGSDMLGMKKMAIAFAKAVNCEKRVDDACDGCSTCVRIAHGNHPDVQWVRPSGKTVKIEQIRTLQQKASYHASELKKQFAIIEGAETMTVQAANSLLKFLEEPVSDFVIVLLAENVHTLLPTVVSRCQLVSFQSVSPHMIVEQLTDEHISRNVATAAASMASSFEEAKELATSDWFNHALALVTQLSEAVNESSTRAIAFIQEQIMSTEIGQQHIEQFLDLMILWYQDMLKVSLGCRQPLAFPNYKDALVQQKAKWTETDLIHGVDQLLTAKREHNQYISAQSVLEGWVLTVQGV